MMLYQLKEYEYKVLYNELENYYDKPEKCFIEIGDYYYINPETLLEIIDVIHERAEEIRQEKLDF